ncbi:MAG: dTMP kinase [Candidatus Aenigmatarchaeota archaeon]
MTGSFIVIEGIDGSGTSTQSKLLKDWLEEKNRETVLTNEPFDEDGNIGKVIKKDRKSTRLDYSPRTIALAFAADRMVHLEDVIKPALEQGKIVVSDRYYHSSLVYQPNHGADFDWVKTLNKYARKPDLTVLLDVPPEEGMDRLERKEDVFETEDFQGEVRKRYIELEEYLDETLYLMSADRDVDEIQKDIRKIVENEILGD